MPRLKPLRGLQVNWNHPLAKGLAGCWLLNEATGEKVADYGLRRKNGHFQYNTAAPVWRAGKHGSAVEFGTERCISCGTHKFGWDLTNEVSVVALVNHGANQTNTIFARSGFVRPCRLSGYAGGKFKWWVYTDGTDCAINSTSSHATDGSEWVHVAGTWRAGDGRLYVNGVQETYESSSTGNLSFVNDSQPVCIGGTYESGSYYYCWNGRIEHVLVYNRALSAAEIRWLYREPFAVFERSISPASIHITTATVSLAGAVGATSAASARLESTSSAPAIEQKWLLDALFNGMTANAFKLGTSLSLGWFWVRVAGCSVLYRGPGMDQIDCAHILSVAGRIASQISPPGYLPHDSNSTYFYVLRRFNHCGYQERTLSAAAKVCLDANGDLVQPQPNKIFASRAEQADGNKIRLIWFYCPVEQESPPVRFNVYGDGRTGQIDFENPIATIDYRGPNLYSYLSDTLEPGRYLFAIRAEDAAGTENSSSGHRSVELDGTGPDAIDILRAQTV